MDSFPRPKREGETRSEYLAAMLELVNRSCAREFPEELSEAKPAGTPSLIAAVSEIQPKPKPAETPLLIRAASVTQPKPARYKKTGGAADGAGENYEWKMLTLVFLRMLEAGHEFYLASNMEAAGLFDDIVLRYRKSSSDPWKVTCLQLKHKQQKNIPKPALLGITGDFSLVKYCASYVSLKSSGKNELPSFDGQFVILYTNASIDGNLVDIVEQHDSLLSTGGTAVLFKARGDIYLELCEWVEFKEVLTKLHGLVDGLSGEELATRIKDALEGVSYQNKPVTSWKEELVKSPTLEKLLGLVKKLEPIRDKATYSSFLAELRVYTNEAHESELDAKIKEQLGKVWSCNDRLEEESMFNNLRDKIKIWWQKETVYLTQDSKLWFDIIKSQTENLSRSTIDFLTKSGAKFVESSLHELLAKISEVNGSGGIFNLRVDSMTAASSLKVHQALAKSDNVIHINLKALSDREEDVMSAWSTRWCRVLVLECDSEIERNHAARIGERIAEVVGREGEKKLLVLIAPEKHALNAQLYDNESYTHFNDNFLWSDLTVETKENFLARKVVINGCSPLFLSELVNANAFVNKVDLDVISQLLCGDLACGKDLDDVGKFFVTRRLIESAEGVPFVVNSVTDVQRKVVLVVAEPGMGKSTLFTHLAKSGKEEDPTAWIVHIKLNDCAQFLKEIDTNDFNKNTVKNFLKQSALSPGNCLERLLFGAFERKRIIFLDGVDEVCPHYEQEVFMLLSFLKDMKYFQVWVASRPVFQAKLENTLKVKTLHLAAFSKQDQMAFFNKVWMESVPLATTEKCKEVTEALLTMVTNSLGKDNPILGVPLMAAMIADTFQERMFAVNGASREIKENSRLNVRKLYTTFVENKFELYCIEKKKTSGRELTAIRNDEDTLKNQMHHNHRLAALRALFSREEIASLQFEGKEKFDQDSTAFLNDVAQGREKIGIIDNVKDGIPHFVHRSFSEYFAASWLTKNYNTNTKFVERITFDPAYKLLIEMFNRALAENHPLHEAVLNRDVEATSKILNDKDETSDIDALDAGGRTPLHLAVLASANDPHPDCIRIVKCLVQEHKARLDVADEVIGWMPLRYAERLGAWAALHSIILQGGGNAKKGGLRLIEQQIKRSKFDSSLMLDAARNASVLVVKYLAEERGGMLDCRGPQGETMVHMAAEVGNVAMLRYLFENGSSINVNDNKNNNALRYASPKALPYLLSRGLNLKAVNKQGLTALQDAAQSGEYEKMTTLFEVNASSQVSPSIKVNESQLNANLLCAAFAGSLETVQDLVKHGASILFEDNNGHTAAWVAMHRGHVAVMDWLMSRGSQDGDTPLNGACRKGETEIVAFILSRGMDIESRGWEGQTPMSAASEAGSLDVINLLLDKGANVECLDNNGWTPLYYASSKGHEQVAALLLRHGADIHARNYKGWSPLNLASWKGHEQVAALLLRHGADIHAGNNNGWTPLNLASWKGHVQVAALLLRHGADIHAGSNKGWTPLHSAASSNRSDVVKLLLDKGANVKCLDENGWTPLNHASSEGHEQVAALLLRHGADIHAGDNKGWTSLHTASWNNKLDVVKLLLEKGANVKCLNNNGWSPLNHASSKGHEQVVALLLRHGADIHAGSSEGWTSLHSAASSNRSDVVKLLLDQRERQVSTGSKFTQVGGAGFTALMAVALRGDKEAVKDLLSNFNAESASINKRDYINLKDSAGWNALHFATSLGHSDVLSFLVSQGGDSEGSDHHNYTLLHRAAEKNHPGAVKVLLEVIEDDADRAAAVDSCDNDGDSVLMCGAWGGSVECVELLVKAGGKLTQVNNYQRTLLMAAVLRENLAVVKYLLGAFDPEKEGMILSKYLAMTDEDGKTAAELASEKGRQVLLNGLIPA